MHGYAAAIDLNLKVSDYWLWAAKGDGKAKTIPYRNRMPREIVDIFERHRIHLGRHVVSLRYHALRIPAGAARKVNRKPNPTRLEAFSRQADFTGHKNALKRGIVQTSYPPRSRFPLRHDPPGNPLATFPGHASGTGHVDRLHSSRRAAHRAAS